jgi:cell division protein FtsN
MNVSHGKIFIFFILVFVCSGVAFLSGVLVGRRSAPVVADSGNLYQYVSELSKSEKAEQPNPRLDSFKFYDRLKERQAGEDRRAPKVPETKPDAEKSGRVSSALKPTSQEVEKSYTVQVAEFSSRQAALKMLSNLTGKGYTAFVTAPRTGEKLQFFRVFVGPCRGREETSRIIEKLTKDFGRGKYLIIESS